MQIREAGSTRRSSLKRWNGVKNKPIFLKNFDQANPDALENLLSVLAILGWIFHRGPTLRQKHSEAELPLQNVKSIARAQGISGHSIEARLWGEGTENEPEYIMGKHYMLLC